MGTVRAELAFPLENRGEGAAAVARGSRGGGARPGHRRTCSTARPSSSPAASSSASPWPPRWPAVRARSLLDEPTSQLDPVAGDELIWLLRRLNEEWGTAILLAEHRLERCLAAADRVIALEDGAVACDARPREFLEWAAGSSPALQTPGARLSSARACARRPRASRRRGPRCARTGSWQRRVRRRSRLLGAKAALTPLRAAAALRAASGSSGPTGGRRCGASTWPSRPGSGWR